MKLKANDNHEYHTHLRWEGNQGEGTSSYSGYDRRFRISVEGKPDLVGSADPSFRGDPDQYNPEDLFLAALSSCHMLTYLAICARKGIAVLEYSDAAHGVMTVTPEGGGQFSLVTLHPQVHIRNKDQESLALELHARAHADCFIAASCNFPVRHQPVVTWD
jgi:organic hydroperoxide reductase OsmC/OhrA